MSDLETRQLRYFVAVAEELHFGRAAERLGMAQPPLSRAIGDLERQLGVALLRRTTRQVSLTPAGEVLLRDARTALDAVTAAGARARHAGEARPRLRLALKADVDGGLLPAILSRFAAEPQALPVELVLGGWGAQAQALRDGRADVGLLLSPFDEAGLDTEPLLAQPLVAALAAGDPLAGGSPEGESLPNGSPAGRPCLRLADLAGRPLFGAGVALRDEGRPGVPEAARGAAGLEQILRLVELGEVVFCLPASVARRYPRLEIAYLPVSDLPPATLAVAWPQDARSPTIAAFVRVATTVAATAAASLTRT
jgi:DNA-binding transcriptional LysR family regulator